MNRRQFIKTTAITGIGMGMNLNKAKLFAGSPNDKISIAMIGLHGRGRALAASAVKQKNIELAYICDVDQRVMEKVIADIEKNHGLNPKPQKDFRKILEDESVDAVFIATPDHWHTPMAIMALQAGKHVYLEKPCSHNPREGELLVTVQKKYKKIIQMGNQQRSAPTSILAVKEINQGVIGRPYFGKAWYSNQRGSIGIGKEVPAPEWLDYELWQGPAPRKKYKDNIIHYNWHWFWNWGTGEILNNGTHEIDVCRWALGVKYPRKVSSSGGRYHFKDDWEFFDTQVTNYEFENNKLITWEGRSCNTHYYHNRGRGVAIHGTKGTVLLDRNAYELYDNDNNLIKKVDEKGLSTTTDILGAGALVDLHIRNFFNAIRYGEKLNSPIDEGHVSVTLCHLGNIAQKAGRTLELNTQNGHIKNDPQAESMWSREYEEDWAPKI